MAHTETEEHLLQAAEHRKLAAIEKSLANSLRHAGYRDLADRHLIDARLHELRATAFAAASRAA